MTPETAQSQKEHGLLSPEERAILSQMASKESPYSQRAQALVAIDEGATQAEAGRLTGLTKGQVRYWLNKFRKERLASFPEELLDQAQQVEADSAQSSAQKAAPPEMPVLDQPVDEEGAQPELPDEEETAGQTDSASPEKEATSKVKKKKSKKAKKSVKTKKSKKDKKASKGKKPGKKTKKDKSQKAQGKKGTSGKKKRKKGKSDKKKRKKRKSGKKKRKK